MSSNTSLNLNENKTVHRDFKKASRHLFGNNDGSDGPLSYPDPSLPAHCEFKKTKRNRHLLGNNDGIYGPSSSPDPSPPASARAADVAPKGGSGGGSGASKIPPLKVKGVSRSPASVAVKTMVRPRHDRPGSTFEMVPEASSMAKQAAREMKSIDESALGDIADGLRKNWAKMTGAFREYAVLFSGEEDGDGDSDGVTDDEAEKIQRKTLKDEAYDEIHGRMIEAGMSPPEIAVFIGVFSLQQIKIRKIERRTNMEEQRRMEEEWKEKNMELNEEALRAVRRHMPVNVKALS